MNRNRRIECGLPFLILVIFLFVRKPILNLGRKWYECKVSLVDSGGVDISGVLLGQFFFGQVGTMETY